jgi:hypothetical protein
MKLLEDYELEVLSFYSWFFVMIFFLFFEI